MYSGVYENNFSNVRNLINNKEFEKAYDLLQKISDKCSEWYYLTGLSSMKIGYYDEGEEYIQKAISLEPDNIEYKNAFNQYNQFRYNYNKNSNAYNYNKRKKLDGCCCCCCDDDCCCLYGCDGCCCCGDDCCENICHLWCLDQCCECTGNDFIDCM